MERLMPKCDDLGRSLIALDQDSTLIAVVELSHASWLVGGLVPGLAREPLKKLAADPDALLRLLHRWRDEATAAGRPIGRICVAYEAGRDRHSPEHKFPAQSMTWSGRIAGSSPIAFAQRTSPASAIPWVAILP
jgi:hypothetical protein